MEFHGNQTPDLSYLRRRSNHSASATSAVPDIVEYSPEDQAPMYGLITGKQTMHDLGVVLDFQEKTIKIDKILLPMRNIADLQPKPSITRALRKNTCFAQEPISTCSATKCMVEILDAKYEKADLPAINRENCSHLKASDREKLLSVLLKFELLFDGTLGDWNLLPVSFELKECMKPYHGRPYLIPHKHKAILMKEIKQLCNIGVLVWQLSIKMGVADIYHTQKRIAQCTLYQILVS